MENRSNTKNVTINDKVYQLNKIDPRTICWLFGFMAGKASGGLILTAFGNCTRAEFDEIQSIALRSIFYLDTKDGNTFPTAILSNGGMFTQKWLEEEPETVMKLTSDFVLFNLSPFLTTLEKE